jgi:hypothetical protein
MLQQGLVYFSHKEEAPLGLCRCRGEPWLDCRETCDKAGIASMIFSRFAGRVLPRFRLLREDKLHSCSRDAGAMAFCTNPKRDIR